MNCYSERREMQCRTPSRREQQWLPATGRSINAMQRQGQVEEGRGKKEEPMLISYILVVLIIINKSKTGTKNTPIQSKC